MQDRDLIKQRDLARILVDTKVCLLNWLTWKKYTKTREVLKVTAKAKVMEYYGKSYGILVMNISRKSSLQIQPGVNWI